MEDPITHASQPSHLYWAKRVESVDETYQGFAYGCALAGPSGCPLATSKSTGAGIVSWTYDLLDLAYDYTYASGDFDYTARSLRSAIHQMLYRPSSWSSFATESFYPFYQGLISTSQSNFQLASRSLPKMPMFGRANSEDEGSDDTFVSISCGDSIDQESVTSQEVFDELLRVVREVSPMFGSQFPQPAHFCHRWPVRAVERYAGPWNSKLANPILIIGNKADPATPFKDALAVADLLGDNAILIEQDGFGHLSLAQKSACTSTIAQNFFIDGTLPTGDDTICEIDKDGPALFSSGSITASGIKSALSDSNSVSGASSEDDNKDEEIKSLKDQKRTLMIVVIALAAAAGIMLLGLIASIFRGRQGRRYTPIQNRGDAGGFPQGRTSYSDPYDGKH